MSNIANFITLSRIVGVAFLFWLMPFKNELFQVITIVLFTLIALTDLLDGFIARRYKIVSDTGKVLDPLADKILVLVFLPLLSMNALSAFPVFLILAREFGIMGLRVFVAKYNIIISANAAGKIKTGITLPLCGILMARPEVTLMTEVPFFLMPLINLKRWVHAWPDWVYNALIILMVLVTIWSFLDYLFRFIWQRKLILHNQDKEKAKLEMLAFIPNSMSFINFLCGIATMYFSMKLEFLLAGSFVLMGMILDGLDGRVARRLGTYSKLGASIDSKADYTTFGVAPAVMLYFYLGQFSLFSGVDTRYFALIISAAYFFSVFYRLRRFSTSGHSDFFEGLPSPIGAGFVVVLIMSRFYLDIKFVIIATLITMYLMVSKHAYPHNQSAHRKLGFKHLRAPVLVMIFFVTVYGLGLTVLSKVYVSEILLGLVFIYFLAPLIPDNK
jgi:CDP-diacylglycerol--glycerol-3-phosphate 3-phosphatidyltransferase